MTFHLILWWCYGKYVRIFFVSHQIGVKLGGITLKYLRIVPNGLISNINTNMFFFQPFVWEKWRWIREIIMFLWLVLIIAFHLLNHIKNGSYQFRVFLNQTCMEIIIPQSKFKLMSLNNDWKMILSNSVAAILRL